MRCSVPPLYTLCYGGGAVSLRGLCARMGCPFSSSFVGGAHFELFTMGRDEVHAVSDGCVTLHYLERVLMQDISSTIQLRNLRLIFDFTRDLWGSILIWTVGLVEGDFGVGDLCGG